MHLRRDVEGSVAFPKGENAALVDCAVDADTEDGLGEAKAADKDADEWTKLLVEASGEEPTPDEAAKRVLLFCGNG